jgi:hypothetical protein
MRERTSGHHRHPCLNENDLVEIDLLDWCKRQGTAGYVRMTPLEFSRIPLPENSFPHYNLSPCQFVPGAHYAAVLIKKPGHFTAGSEKKPQIDLHRWVRLECLSTQNDVPFAEVSAAVLEAVWTKYHQSLPDLARTEFLACGLCVSQFLVKSV